ncbi:malto-oligosyltrehalose trehalohydrolase [Cellulomonas sp. Root485]|uniref:malto-oligosyltrehalose trehalohydrolase n=1 Tax=Cellulomonas sp. Root485 TaxID=1736546 RepID=UPI000701899C|nr:malto-oligosyltrehalose trehalohydrolase [Cellulomonas sp. Root485]KQY24978.1 malto-oligosyltrehalose trehalohydrolase [Cellulomonas sp. Root485]
MLPRVWAPTAARVDVVVGDEHRPLRAEGDWWVGDDDLPHGTDYAFSVDGGPPRPDPRSAWQPHGVHGASRVYDPGTHPWSDDGWSGVDVRGHVTYELHVGTFSDEGTLTSAIEHLDELVSLGVDLVELMPVAPFSGVHGWGYDGVATFAVHEPYGGPAGLQAFVDAAHSRGVGVCLDVVHNHLGPSGNYLGDFGPYFTDAHQTPWGSAINLDGPGSEEVRRWVCDSALRWFRDFHVDALRLDAVHALIDLSDRHVLSQLSDEVAALAAALGRRLSLVAESDLNDPISVTPTADGGWGMTAQWDDDVHHAIHALVTGERHGYYGDFGSPEVLRKALTGVFVHDGEMSTFRGRRWGRPVPPGTDGHRFVVAASTHDQVGNRALGDRPSARLDPGRVAAEAALVLLSPFSPMLFMGEEWGTRTPWQFFTDHPEPDLAAAVRDGRRREFGGHGWDVLYGGDIEVPDPQDPATFRASILDRTELDDPAHPEHARLRDWYRSLIALRRTVPDLASGDLSATDLVWGGASERDQDDVPWDGWLVLHRGTARVVINLSGEEAAVPVHTDGPVDVVAAWDPASVEPTPGGALVLTAPRSVVVLA